MAIFRLVFLNILMNSIQSIEKQASVENAGLSGTPSELGSSGALGQSCAAQKYSGEITITTAVLGDKLSVRIEDNGFGIKEEDKKKIFQAGFTTKKVGEGTGLGLAICKKIIEKHKGEITFESTSYRVKAPAAGSLGVKEKIAKSTVFEIILPV